MREYVNKEYLETHKTITIRLEMDEMWSFYHDKKHQIRLWWAIDHESGEAIAFWFGTREHENLDKLLELLAPLNLGKVYTDGNYAYFTGGTDSYEEEQAKDRKETSVTEDLECPICEERDPVHCCPV
jgi:IS1 family transposase